MHDGDTRQVRVDDEDRAGNWLARNRASLILLSGPNAGIEYELDAPRLLIGRSATAGVRLDDPSVSSEHAAIELGSDGFGVRDLASTNGVRVNGAVVLVAELKHSDRIECGECELQYLVEARSGRTWQIEDA